MKRTALLRTLIIAGALPFASVSNLQAATTDTWNGGGTPNGNWQVGANWGGTAPQALDFLIFDGATQTSNTNDFPAGTIFGNLSFSGSADIFNLYGNSLVLTNGSDAGGGNTAGGGITNSSANVETINIPITLSPGRHGIATDSGAGQLSLAGAITRNTGAGVMFGVSGGALNVTGSGLANINGILGGWALIGNDFAALDGGNNVIANPTYTDIGSGAVANNAASNIRYMGDTANLTAANGTAVNSILSQVSGANRTLTVTGLMKLGSRGGVYHNSSASVTFTVTGGNLTAAGGGELTFSSKPGTTSGGLSVNSVITNDTGNAAVSVNVQGYTTMNAANTYSGGTYIFNNGRMNGNNNLSMGRGPAYVYAGGQAFFGGGATWTNDFFISGIGTTETSGGQTMGAIRFPTATAAITGTINLVGDTRVSAGSGAVSTMAGKVTGPGRLELTAATGSTTSIAVTNAANDWSGGLLLTAAVASRSVFFKLGGHNAIPDGVGKGNVTLVGGSSVARFDLNGFSDTINGLVADTNANNQLANFGTNNSILALGGNNASANFGGTISDNGPGTNLSIVKIGSGTQVLAGAASYNGNTTVSGGTLVFPGSGTFPTPASGSPVVTINSNATLDFSGVSQVTMSPSSTLVMSNGTIYQALAGTGNALTVSNLTAIGATNFVKIASIPSISTYPAQFVAIKYTTLNGSLNFGLGGSLPVVIGAPPYNGFISNNVANGSVDLVILSGPASTKWSGYSSGAPNSAWDNSTPNWKKFDNSGTTYSDGNFVFFDDSASNSLVTLNQVVSPAGITISNNTLSYTLNDISGQYITGGGGLLKQGSGTFILDQAGINDFGGDVTIASGTLQVGNNDTAGNIPATADVLDNGTLAIKRSDTPTIANQISGTGAVTINGSGTVTLSAANTFTGAVNVTQGTLLLGNNSALGTTNGATIVSSGATLDIGQNTINIGQEPVTISGTGVGGTGALVNNSGSATFVAANLARLTLAGDAVVGGSGRMDLRSATTSNPNQSSLSTGGQPYKLTKVGANQISIVGVTFDAALGDIDVQQGALSIETATTSIGNTLSNLIVRPGAELHLFAPTNLLNKKFFVGGDGVAATVDATSGNPIIVGPMTITNDCLFTIANGTGISLTLSNTLFGDGILHKKTGTNTLTISGLSSNFAGGITVDQGTLTLSGNISNALGVRITAGIVNSRFNLNGILLGSGLTNDSQTFVAGNGTASGIVDVSGTLQPGASGGAAAGTFTASGLNLQGGSVVEFDITTNSTVGGGVNDLVQVNGDLTVNSPTLTIKPNGLLLTGAGNPYRLFNYTGNLIWNGDFSVPSVNAYTFAIDTNTAGQVNLIVSGGPPVWNGASTTDSLWSDAANWAGVAIASGNDLYFGGATRLSNTNDTSALTSYNSLNFIPGASSFTLNGNPIVLGTNINSSSANPQTVLLGLNFGTTITLNGGGGGLIIGGGLTNTSTSFVNLNLAGTGTLTNILNSTDPNGTNSIFVNNTNANWTLVDNASSTPMTVPWNLDIRQGTFNFGVGASAPNFSSITVNGQPQDNQVGVTTSNTATFNMVNGTLTTVARLNTATVNTSTGIVNQVGGTLNIGQQFQGANGGTSNALSQVTVSGGTMNLGGGTGQFYVASRDRGFLTINGTGAINCGNLDVSRDAQGNTRGSIGTVNLDGGIITCGRVGTATANSQAGPPTSGVNPTATFNFNGGILRARASAANFFQGNAASPAIPITAIVKVGGAKIDDNGFAIAVLEPLQHDSTLGATPDGGLLKLGAGTVTLGAANTYTGGTTVSNGTLAVNGSIGVSAVTVATNGTLAGVGTIGSNVTVNPGGSVSPAGPGTAGTLTVAGNVTMQGNATSIMELNKSLGTNDLLRATNTTATTITYSGTLEVTNLAGTLAGGDSFKLFSATNYAGSFTTILPPQPGIGLKWDTSQLNVSGTIRMTALPRPGITGVSFSGGNVLIGGTNGTAGFSYRVLGSSDVTLPLASWTILGTNVFDGSGNFSFSSGATNALQFFAIQAL